jgi:electron transfer flavoprotein alpha subunit
MSKVLIVAQHEAGRLSAATAKTLACAVSIPDAVTSVCVFASDGHSVAEQAAQLAGVSEVLLIDNPAHGHPLAALIAPQLAEIAQGFSHVLGPSTTFGRDLMPRVAALLRTAQISEIMAVESATRFRRPVYAGNAIATVEVACAPIVATVRIASFQAVSAGQTPAPVTTHESATDLPTHTRFVSQDSESAKRVDLQSARRVVSGGRGVGSAAGFQHIEALADTLGAAIGASRAAVDAGYVANDLQVGQTGKIIAPELYIAAGISGAIQHLTGIRDAGTIVAINQDSEAPIFEVADIGLVGDLFAVLPELTEKIRKHSP